MIWLVLTMAPWSGDDFFRLTMAGMIQDPRCTSKPRQWGETYGKTRRKKTPSSWATQFRGFPLSTDDIRWHPMTINVPQNKSMATRAYPAQDIDLPASYETLLHTCIYIYINIHTYRCTDQVYSIYIYTFMAKAYRFVACRIWLICLNCISHVISLENSWNVGPT